jgi:hypothetical protein
MNAPVQSQRLMRDQYIPTLARLMPDAQGKERDMRCSLLLMRDNAMAAMRRCGDDAYPVLNIVSNTAARYAFERMPVDDLEHIRWVLLRLTTCASDLESFTLSLTGPAHKEAQNG